MKPEYELNELDILLECVRDETRMYCSLYNDRETEATKKLLADAKAIDEYPFTMVWFFHDEVRETKLVNLGCPRCGDYRCFLKEVAKLLKDGWYPVYTEMSINADGKDDYRWLDMRYYRDPPTVEDQAIFEQLFISEPKDPDAKEGTHKVS